MYMYNVHILQLFHYLPRLLHQQIVHILQVFHYLLRLLTSANCTYSPIIPLFVPFLTLKNVGTVCCYGVSSNVFKVIIPNKNYVAMEFVSLIENITLAASGVALFNSLYFFLYFLFCFGVDLLFEVTLMFVSSLLQFASKVNFTTLFLSL